MTALEAFLQLLDDAITEAGSQHQLAVILKCHPSLITRWRKEDRTPSLTAIQPVLDYMSVDAPFQRATQPSIKITNTNTNTVNGHQSPEPVPASWMEQKFTEMQKQNEALLRKCAELEGEKRALNQILDRLWLLLKQPE